MELGFGKKTKASSQKHQMVHDARKPQEQRIKNRVPDLGAQTYQLKQTDPHSEQIDCSFPQSQERPLHSCSTVLRTDGIRNEIQKNQTQTTQNQKDECELSLQNESASKSIQEEMKNMDISFIKMSMERKDLEQKMKVAEQDLCHYKNQVREYQNKQHNLMLKYQEEVNNRQSVESKVEYVSSVNQIVEQHFQEISQTLSAYGEINNQHTDFNARTASEIGELKKQFEEVFGKFKIRIEELQTKNLLQRKKRDEEVDEERKIRSMLEQTINECNAKLRAECDKNSLMEKDLVQSQLLVKEKIREHEFAQKSADEKFTQLLRNFEKLDIEAQSLKKENSDMKIIVSQFEDVKNIAEKRNQEYQALSANFETTSRKLAVLEEENEVKSKNLKELNLEQENKVRRISILEEQYLESSMKIKEGICKIDRLNKEIEDRKTKSEMLSEELSLYKKTNERQASELESLNQETQIYKTTCDSLKAEICQLQEKVQTVLMEIENKNKTLEVTKEELQELTSRMKEVQLSNNQMQDDIYEKENTIKQLKENIEEKEIELKIGREIVQKAEQAVREASNENARKLKDMTTHISSFQFQYDQDVEALTADKKKLESEQKFLLTEIDTFKSEKDEHINEIKHLNQNIKNLEHENEKLERLNQNLENDLEKEQKKLKKKDVAQKELVADLNKSISNLESEKWQLEAKVKQQEKELGNLGVMKRDNENLRARVEQVEGEKEELNEKLRQANSKSSLEIPHPVGLIQKAAAAPPPPMSKPVVPRRRVSFEDEGMTSDSSVDIPTFFTQNLRKLQAAKKMTQGRASQLGPERQKRKADTTSTENRALETTSTVPKRSLKKIQSDMLDSL